MAIDPALYARLKAMEPEQAAPDTPAAAAPIAPPNPSENTPALKAIGQTLKSAVAETADQFWSGARLMLKTAQGDLSGFTGGAPNPNTWVPEMLQPGYAKKSVDYESLKRVDPLLAPFLPAVKGIGGMASFPVPAATLAGAAAKTLTLGIGAGEGSEIGKYIFSNLFPMLGSNANKSILPNLGQALGAASGIPGGSAVGQTIGSKVAGLIPDPDQLEQIGAGTGQIVGSMVGANANMIRMNVIGQALSVPWNAAKAGKQWAQAKLAEDSGVATNATIGNYYDALKAQSLGMADKAAVNEIAGLLARNPLTLAINKQFVDATDMTRVSPNLFSLGQRAGSVDLTKAEIARSLSPAEAATAFIQKEQQTPAIQAAYNRIVDHALPTNPQGLEQGLEMLRMGTVAKGQQIATAAGKTADGVDRFSSVKDADASGDMVRNLLLQNEKAAKATFDPRYDQVFAAAPDVNILGSLSVLQRVLDPLLETVKTSTAPASIRMLDSLLTRNKTELVAQQSNQMRLTQEAGMISPNYQPGAFIMRDPPPQISLPGTFSFKEMHDLTRTLSSDAQTAYHSGAYDGKTIANNLNDVNRFLQAQMEHQVPGEIWQQYRQIQADYATKVFGRFQTETNSKWFGQENGIPNVKGQEMWDGSANSYLYPKEIASRMVEFDNAFSGKLALRDPTTGAIVGGRVPEAYDQLGRGLQNLYNDNVLRNFSVGKHQDFMYDYGPALDKVPQVAQKLESTASNLDQLSGHAERVLDNYKQVTGTNTSGSLGAVYDAQGNVIPGQRAPTVLAKHIGGVQAQNLLEQTMADPAKMDAMLRSPIGNTPEKAQSLLKQAMIYSNPWDKQGTLSALLDLGTMPGRPGTLTQLSRAAYGPELGDLHIARLKAIDELMSREAMTDPAKILLSQKGKGPLEDATGNTAASLLGNASSLSRGFGNPVYWSAVVGGRFINNQIGKATARAMDRALYDPAYAQTVLDVVGARQGNPTTSDAVRSIYGGGDAAVALLKQMSDYGFIKSNTARAALFGMQEAVEKKDERGSNAWADQRRRDALKGMIRQ